MNLHWNKFCTHQTDNRVIERNSDTKKKATTPHRTVSSHLLPIVVRVFFSLFASSSSFSAIRSYVYDFHAVEITHSRSKSCACACACALELTVFTWTRAFDSNSLSQSLTPPSCVYLCCVQSFSHTHASVNTILTRGNWFECVRTHSQDKWTFLCDTTVKFVRRSLCEIDSAHGIHYSCIL